MPLWNGMILVKSLTPSARAASIGVSEESYDLTTELQKYPTGNGTQAVLLAGDVVTVTVPSAMNTNVAPMGCRVVSATNIAIQWGNLTAVANTPPAGNYTFFIQRQ